MPKRPLRFRSRDEQKAAFAKMRQGRASIFSRRPVLPKKTRKEEPEETASKVRCGKCGKVLQPENTDPEMKKLCKECADDYRKQKA